MIRSKKYLAAARGKSCVNCGVRDGTVVAAHYSGLRQHLLGKGRGIKCHDICVADLCSECHQLYDTSRAGMSFSTDREMRRIDNSEQFLFSIVQTIIRRIKDGDLIFGE